MMADNNDIPSPTYSPISWDELSVDLDNLEPSVDQSPSPGAVSESQQPLLDANALLEDRSSFTAHSSAGGGHLVETEVGDFFFNSDWEQRLTESTPILSTKHWGMDDESLPNVRLLPDGTYTLDTISDTFPNIDSNPAGIPLPNTTLQLGRLFPTTNTTMSHYFPPAGNVSEISREHCKVS